MRAVREGTATGLFTIERHGNRAQVPWSWLTVGLAIKCG